MSSPVAGAPGRITTPAVGGEFRPESRNVRVLDTEDEVCHLCRPGTHCGGPLTICSTCVERLEEQGLIE
jgi:hypothetical protein